MRWFGVHIFQHNDTKQSRIFFKNIISSDLAPSDEILANRTLVRDSLEAGAAVGGKTAAADQAQQAAQHPEHRGG